MTDQTAALRDRIARWEQAAWAAGRTVDRNTLAVYLAVADQEQAAALREASDRLWALANRTTERGQGVLWAADWLRRVADETAATETQAHEPLRQWRVEILDGDEWMPASGLRRDRSQAAEQLRMSSEQRPLWKDGTQVQRRLVRETTTYSVEAGPAANCLCGVLRTGPGRHLPECPNGTAAGARQDGAQR